MIVLDKIKKLGFKGQFLPILLVKAYGKHRRNLQY